MKFYHLMRNEAKISPSMGETLLENAQKKATRNAMTR